MRTETMETNAKHETVKARFAECQKGPRPPIGEELVGLMADWARVSTRGMHSYDPCGWREWFFRWALRGRTAEFVEYARSSPHPHARKALAGIRWVYDMHWPHSATCGYWFHAIWGWCQLELKKPGERAPMTRAEQAADLKAYAESRGEVVTRWHTMGPGLIVETAPKGTAEPSTIRIDGKTF